MTKEKNYYKNEFDSLSFLDKARLKESQDKIDSGEITCNTDSPEDCESCSG
jgi:hypothetical protein|tara:strand:- start:484 stop:636 length:153 start_codon:yes stop_codon:yes gene_type:complete